MIKKTPLVAIVDDEEAVGRALKRLLRSAGFNVVTYTSGAVFLGSLVHNPPDCVVLDLHMPVIDGFQVQEHLTELNAGIPILVITGHDSPRSRQLALDAGATAYFTKPVDDQSLIDAINNALMGHASQ